MTAKKPVERNRVISLLNCLGIGHLDPEDTESPDFLIRSEKHTIGIEVTSLVSTRAPNQDNPNQAARVSDHLVGGIFAQYTEAGGPPVNASLKFREGIRIARADIARVARELGVVLARQIRELHAGQQIPPSVEVGLDRYGLVRVAAWPCLAGRSPRWHRDVSGMVDYAQPEDILATIAGKESKIEAYRLRADGGVFFREMWIEGRGRNMASLHTTDREEARQRAEAFYLALLQGEQPTPTSALTLGALWERYQQEAPAYRQLIERTRKERKGHARLLLAALGQDKRVEHLTLADVEQYVALRRRGTGWPDGRITKPVRARATASELHVLRTMLLWATRVRQADGSWLLRDYPLRGLKLPREEDVRRPIATHDRFLKLREAICTLAETAPQRRGRQRWVRIELALVLAEATGARIGAIRGLRWSDITYSPPRIRWRAEFDKKGRERLVPIPESLVQELRLFQAKLGGIGDGWLFPRADGSGPWPRDIFREQLLVAEEKAGLEHLKGGAWHPFRRKWATERKDLPLVDVKATGGWKDTNTLLTCYQQTDEESMLRVMEAPRKLRSVG